MDPSAGKASALPRPSSKLPVFSKARPAPGSATAANPPPTKQPDLPVAPAKSTIGTPRVAKRASSATLSRTSSHTAPAKEVATPSKPVTTSTNLPNGVRNSVRASTGGTISSRAKSLKRPSSTSYARPPINGDEGEQNDRLSSLDSFRSASRQGLRSASVEETPFDGQDDADALVEDTNRSRASRPSLSDRTIESLQSLPSTPKERRRSSFFNPIESPMGPPPRPASSLSRNGSSNGSRPGTSDGNFAKPSSRSTSPAKRAPATAQPSSRTTSRVPSISSTTSSRRSISGSFTSKLQGAKSSATGSSIPGKKTAASTSNGHIAKPSLGSKATPATTRVAKPKPSLGVQPAAVKRTEHSSSTSENAPEEPKRVVSNSSAALRQQIAAAKAAARKEKAAVKHDSPQGVHAGDDDGNFEFDLHADPFNQAPKDEKHILRNRINTARMDGKLNIAAMGLKEIPEEVRKMYDAAAMEESKVNWAEVVDLTRLIAADNEFEQLGDDVFPDRLAEELAADEEGQGNQFGGLELLDLHGNSLQSIPLGLRRLERLTSLNLSHNKLENSALDVVAQIKTLKELRIGHNSLTGNVPATICDLPSLEVLDLQANKLLGLPEALRELVSLRVLNVSGNQLTALPMEAIQQLPLTELDASSNALIMSLVPLGGPSGHSTLQVLNAANNSLAALTFSESLDMPQLRTLNVTNNHLTVLPPVTGWTELITLTAGDNKISEFPQGFTSLRKLRNVNLSSNDIRLVDPEIGRMDSLESLILASNPLREKKFLTMTAADIKRDLKSRLPLALDTDDYAYEEPTSPVTVIGDYERSTSMWSLKANGVLDLAARDLSDDLSPTLGSFLNGNEVKQMLLQSNKITCIPPALWMGQELRVLDLSDNIMSADYLSDELLLPSLQELNLSRCRISSWEPLTSQLQAPNLRTLNIATNRLAGALPALRAFYPQMTTLYANDNRITTISADALRGMITVNLASNDIEQLPAEVGLLWDEGLKNFEVGSNAFRVPNYRLLEKGTEATLRWLRDRLPAGDRTEGEGEA